MSVEAEADNIRVEAHNKWQHMVKFDVYEVLPGGVRKQFYKDAVLYVRDTETKDEVLARIDALIEGVAITLKDREMKPKLKVTDLRANLKDIKRRKVK